MHVQRARIKREIITEFVRPARRSNRVIILATGLPSIPSKKPVLEFLSRQGFWVFLPRYRGTWESEGIFLKREPYWDLLDVVDALPRGFTSIWERQRLSIRPTSLHIIGSSFGGTAALFASRDKRVDGAAALSPVIDWSVPSKAEPIEEHQRYIHEAFGQAYRPATGAFKKLQDGRFYNPASEVESFEGSKLVLFQAKDDEIVPFRPTERFARQTRAQLHLASTGGHFSLSDLIRPRLWKHLSKFVK